MTLKCKFGKPEHGWLSVELSFDEHVLELVVSDVPANPIDSLILGLDRTINGLTDEIFLHLEPDGYYLCFERLAENSFSFRLERSGSDATQPQNKPVVWEKTGNKHEIIFPFWRAIKEFASHSYKKPAWPAVDDVTLSKLTKSVKET